MLRIEFSDENIYGTSFTIFGDELWIPGEELMYGDIYLRHNGTWAFYWISPIGNKTKMVLENRLKQLVLDYLAERELLDIEL